MGEIYKLVRLTEFTKEDRTSYFAVLYVSKRGKDTLHSTWVNKETGEYLKNYIDKDVSDIAALWL